MGPQVKSQGSPQGKGRSEAPEGERGCYIAALENGGLGPRAMERRQPPEARKGWGIDFVLKAPDETQPCHRLAFNSMRPALELASVP